MSPLLGLAFEAFLDDAGLANVPLRVYGPVLDRIELPDAEAIDPEKWFGLA